MTKERKILDPFAQELLKREELEYDYIEAIFAEFGRSRKHLMVEGEHVEPPSIQD